jgi:pSer/pThr/pTyr-binding forkhead associated (FHA) protein
LLAATNYASVIRPLQVIALCVAGLFLLRVMRVAIVEVRPPRERTARTPRGERTRETRRNSRLGFEILEPTDRAGERYDVDGPLTIGRGVECDVVVPDTYISGLHARLSNDDGDLMIEDLDSTNGTYVNQHLIKHRTRLERGDIVQVGGVLLEVIR